MWLQAFDARSSVARAGQVESVRTVLAPDIHTLLTERGDLLQSSPSHLLITDVGDVEGTPVAQLRAGDRVMVSQPGLDRMVPTRLIGVQRSQVPRPVYGIEMASAEHTYVSADLVSHNKCVSPDTPVQLAEGGWIPARDVRAGMWLHSFDAQTCERRFGQVEAIQEVIAPSLLTLFTERGDLLQSSPSHLLISGAGDVDGTAANQFRAGDKVMVYEQKGSRMVPTRVTGVHVSSLPSPVCAIEMKSLEHTYVSAGVVSHNISIKDIRPEQRAEWMRDAEKRQQRSAKQSDDLDPGQ